jgi:6-pyruvoyltetrahydropterin/6-carboxytetrahydropterin synthase
MKITCTRSLGFDAGHRVMLHESKCKYLHGHRYTVEATFEAAAGLDSVGRVVDFGVVKEKLGAWIDAHWDHTVILWDKDEALGQQVAAITQQKIYYLPFNPTAENMAGYLLSNVCPQLFGDTGLTCIHIRLYETPNCFAEAAR